MGRLAAAGGSKQIRMTALTAATPPMGLDVLLVYEEVEKLVDNGWTSDSPVLVLDVRSPPEVEQHGTIPGALNINVRTLEDTLALCQEDFENQVNHLLGWSLQKKVGGQLVGSLLQERTPGCASCKDTGTSQNKLENLLWRFAGLGRLWRRRSKGQYGVLVENKYIL